MMKIIEEKEEGLIKLIGNENVLIFTNGYFYHGKLVGVNETCVKLEKPSIVYETGKFSEPGFKDIQSLCVDVWYVSMHSIESFGVISAQ